MREAYALTSVIADSAPNVTSLDGKDVCKGKPPAAQVIRALEGLRTPLDSRLNYPRAAY